MKSFSNTYIFVFSALMVIIVATLLSFVSEQLRPIQEKNVEVEKKLDILRSVGIARDIDEVKNKNEYVEQIYAEEIDSTLVINTEGEVQEGVEAFSVDLKIELTRKPEERNLPIFIHTTEQGKEIFIVPLQGKGLWGPIWGYVSFEPDLSTIYGAIFSHAKETPGLGAEIDEFWFQEQFFGKTVFNEAGEFTSISVLKAGADPDDLHAVDAISGGTITSVAVENMMKECIGNYRDFFNKHSN